MISEAELQEHLKRLDEISHTGIVPGVGRLRQLYSPDEDKVIRMMEEWMQEIGLVTRHDAAGNLIGRLEGTNPEAKVIATGSHIDSVKNGGHLDGVLGAVSALTAVDHLVRNYGRPRIPIEVIAFRGEEASRFKVSYAGSLAWVGRLKDWFSFQDSDGITLQEAMLNAGYDPERVQEARRNDLAHFIELHIEQGPLLEHQGVPVAVVSGIIGIHWHHIKLRGRTDHAGGSPMHLRRDPVLAAVRMIDAATRYINGTGTQAVVTCGHIKATPSVPNIIAGECDFTFDLRDIDATRLAGHYEKIRQLCYEIAKEHDVEIEWQRTTDEPPTLCDANVQEIMRQACDDLSIPYVNMASGGGHDSQIVAELCPVNMLFVASVGGRSHCPEEYTHPTDMKAGVSVLAETLKRMAY